MLSAFFLAMAGRTGLSTLAVKAIAIVVAACLLASAVAVYNSNLRKQGAQELSDKLKANDEKTIEQKAKNDEELRKMDHDELCKRLAGGLCD